MSGFGYTWEYKPKAKKSGMHHSSVVASKSEEPKNAKNPKDQKESQESFLDNFGLVLQALIDSKIRVDIDGTRHQDKTFEEALANLKLLKSSGAWKRHEPSKDSRDVRNVSYPCYNRAVAKSAGWFIGDQGTSSDSEPQPQPVPVKEVSKVEPDQKLLQIAWPIRKKLIDSLERKRQVLLKKAAKLLQDIQRIPCDEKDDKSATEPETVNHTLLPGVTAPLKP